MKLNTPVARYEVVVPLNDIVDPEKFIPDVALGIDNVNDVMEVDDALLIYKVYVLSILMPLSGIEIVKLEHSMIVIIHSIVMSIFIQLNNNN